MKKFTTLFTLICALFITTATATNTNSSLYSADENAAEPITVTISPSTPVSCIYGDGDVTFSFNKAVTYTAPTDGLKFVNKNGDVVCNVTSLIFNGAKNNAFVMLDSGINEGGTYTITIPAGTFTSEDGAVSEEMTFTLTVEIVVPEPSWWTDFDYTEVTKEFNKLTISFDNLTSLKLNEGNAYLFDAAGNEEAGKAKITEEDKDGNKQTKIEITFNQYTEPGNYQIYIPEGLFTMNDNVNNEEKLLPFEIIAPIQVTPLEIVSVKALENGLLEIVYNQNIILNWDGLSKEITIINDKNEEVTLNKYETPEWPSMRMLYTSTETTWNGHEYEIVPIVAGTYTVDVAQVIVKYGYDSEIYDYVAQGACEGIYTVTISDTAIKGIDAESANTEIYDITGRRVKEITKAGIYIINGTKKVVK